MSNVCLELNPFEAGLLLGVMIKEMANSPENKDVIEPIFKRLSEICQQEYYTGDKSNE